MSRKLRSHVVDPAFPLHVILRGNSRRRLFSYSSCYRCWLRYLDDALAWTGCRVHGLALMTNHVHFVMTTPDAPALSRCIKRLAHRYAIQRNRLQGGSGKLYEERFTAIPITTNEQLALTLAYVDLNPVRAGVAPAPEAYPWSTYALHTGAPSDAFVARVWTPHDWYLGLSADPATRARRYRDWVASRRAEEIEEVAAAMRDRDDEATPRPRVKRPDDSRVG